MKKIILTKGLPGSGKTTWAKELINKEPGKWKRINKDDLRLMLDNSKWSKENEQFILLLRDTIALAALEKGFNVIVDDTNLHPKHELHIRELAKTGNAEFEIKDFTDVSLEECIHRDSMRVMGRVGAKVIKDMFKQFLKKDLKAPEFDPHLSPCIICDIDGTLALFGDKNAYERDFINDQLNKPVAQVLSKFSDRHDEIFLFLVSGRKNKFQEETMKWLENNEISYSGLFMPRADDDNRKDVILKQEIYEREIKGKYNVLFVLDDRNQVVEFWRSQGLTCFQVAEGDF